MFSVVSQFCQLSGILCRVVHSVLSFSVLSFIVALLSVVPFGVVSRFY